MTYLLLKWLHVLAVIVLVGSHVTYGFWIVRGSSHPEALPFTLRNIIWIDRHLALPAYGVLITAGFAIVITMRISFTTPWLLAGLVLLVLLLLGHLVVYSPLLHRLSRLLETEGSGSPAYQAAAHREARLGIALVILMFIIVYLMVVKPGLWS